MSDGFDGVWKEIHFLKSLEQYKGKLLSGCIHVHYTARARLLHVAQLESSRSLHASEDTTVSYRTYDLGERANSMLWKAKGFGASEQDTLRLSHRCLGFPTMVPPQSTITPGNSLPRIALLNAAIVGSI